MKRILGSLFLLPLFAFGAYSWEMRLAKNEVYKDELFMVEFICQFEGRDPDIYIELKPKVKGMEFERLDFTDNIVDNKRRVHYRYVAHALQSGAIPLTLTALMRETTEASIKETTIGRDNNKELVFIDTKVSIKPQTLTVKEHGVSSNMVGDFVIQEHISSELVKAFEPVQLVRKIKGVGNFKALPAMNLTIKGVKIFANDVVEKLTLTPKGYEGEMIFRYALIGDSNFTVPHYALPFFNTQTKLPSIIKTSDYAVAVTAAPKTEELLDDEIYPDETVVVDWANYLQNLALYLLGMLTLYIAQKSYSLYKKERPKAWYESTASVDALLLQLISRDAKRYEPIIEQIEAHKQEKSVKRLKYYKLLLKQLQG